MSEALEKAAKALWEAFPERVAMTWEKRGEHFKEETRREARAAITAFLSEVGKDAKAIEHIALAMAAEDQRSDPDSMGLYRVLAERAVEAMLTFPDKVHEDQG